MEALCIIERTRNPSGVAPPVSPRSQRTDARGLAATAAEALSDLARVSLEGASRAELAACATRWLERMVPGCRAVVIEASPGSDEAVLVSDTEASGRHLHARFSFGPGSALAAAYAEPLKAFQASGPELQRSVSGYAVERGDVVLICAGVMGQVGARAVLAALMSRERLADNRDIHVAMPILASQLAVAMSVAKNRAAAAVASQAITRAKTEWERTVDALPDFVALLDAEGRVVRANRVVEQWGLGRVADVIGRPVHAVVHPDCRREPCQLAEELAAAWQRLQKSGPTHFDYRHDELDKDLYFMLRPMSVEAPTGAASPEVRAVLVVSDVSELSRAREALNAMNAGLETRIRARTQELREANRGLRNEVVRRKAAEEALRTSNSERSLLSQQLLVAQENERHRIARELHDAVGQSLSAVKYSIEQAVEMLRRPNLGDALPVLMRAVRGTRDAAETLREIATSLRPTTLDDMGAASAVHGFCREFADVYRDVEFDLQLTAGDDDVPDRLATALFRSAQEMLNNVVKHAQAARVRVVLKREPMLLLLEVTDDGVGIADAGRVEAQTRGHGLRNLRERAELTGGTFELAPGSQGGTVARIAWPLQHDGMVEGDGA